MLVDLTSFYAVTALIVERLVAAVAGYMVYKDAAGRPERTFNLAPAWWGLAVFFAGAVLGVVGYWLMHYSGLRTAGESSAGVSGEPSI